MRELVCRGVATLPGLLDHLGDARPTGLSVGHGGFFGATWHSDEYGPRHADPKRHPPGVNTGLESGEGFEHGEPHGRRYTLRVGDLCYVALGQVVNRPLSAVRYQPTACLVVNSPVRTPALAAAARADWAGLDAEQHRRSLTQDAFFRCPYAAPSALKRLCFYYPDTGVPLALKFLARPLIKRGLDSWGFVTTQLLGEEDHARWVSLIDEFRARQGQASADLIPCSLGEIVRDIHREEQHRKGQAGRILAEVYPWYDPYAPPFIDAARVGDQSRIIEDLAPFGSRAIDASAADVFRRALALGSGEYWERVEVDDLALACLPRLIGKGHDETFRDWLADRVKAIESTLPSSPERYRLDQLRQWSGRLAGRQDVS